MVSVTFKIEVPLGFELCLYVYTKQSSLDSKRRYNELRVVAGWTPIIPTLHYLYKFIFAPSKASTLDSERRYTELTVQW